MAESRKNSEKPTAERFGETPRRRRIPILLVIAAAAAGLLAGAFLMLREGLFTGNPRLTLRRVRIRVHGTSYWRDREKELCSRVGLNPESGVNLYLIDLKSLRRSLERIPSIASAEVMRMPPDTIEVRLEERIPRAALGNPRSPFVIDEYCVVMPRTESAGSQMRLPVVTGISLRQLRPGTAEPRLQGAVDLIMTTLRGFPDIRILQISVARPGFFDLRLTYRENILYHVILPVRNSGTAFLLSALQSAIIAARRRGDNRTTFDLSFAGQVIVR